MSLLLGRTSLSKMVLWAVGGLWAFAVGAATIWPILTHKTLPEWLSDHGLPRMTSNLWWWVVALVTITIVTLLVADLVVTSRALARDEKQSNTPRFALYFIALPFVTTFPNDVEMVVLNVTIGNTGRPSTASDWQAYLIRQNSAEPTWLGVLTDMNEAVELMRNDGIKWNLQPWNLIPKMTLHKIGTHMAFSGILALNIPPQFTRRSLLGGVIEVRFRDDTGRLYKAVSPVFVGAVPNPPAPERPRGA